MENESSEQSGSIGAPRGGPIFLPNMEGHITTVPEFQSSYLDLLQDLETHLSLDSQQFDISTDSLRIYTEEELTDIAMREAFKEDNVSENELEVPLDVVSPPEDPSSGKLRRSKRQKKVKKTATGKQKTVNDPSSDVIPPENISAGKGRKKKRQTTVKKTGTKSPTTAKMTRTKKQTSAKKTEDAYLAKVEQLAKLKQKQDEDKLDCRLHCFSESGNDVGSSQESFKKMQSLKSINNYTLVKPSDIQGPVDTLFPEVVLCVEIYDSRKIKTQEFLVLGRQTLTELKDKIHCLTDQVMIKAGTYDPSGYFLIEDVFHNDLRDPSATDYSKPILEWLWNSTDEALEKWGYLTTGESKRKPKKMLGEAKSMELPRFGSENMQSTRFCDLRFRLGASYLYCHQGDCKHMIVIRDMRLSHPDDVQNRAVYPRVMFQMKARIQKCDICNIHRATKFAVDDKFARENSCHFCDTCFLLLHNEEGSLPFPIYDYLYDLHRNPLLFDHLNTNMQIE